MSPTPSTLQLLWEPCALQVLRIACGVAFKRPVCAPRGQASVPGELRAWGGEGAAQLLSPESVSSGCFKRVEPATTFCGKATIPLLLLMRDQSRGELEACRMWVGREASEISV